MKLLVTGKTSAAMIGLFWPALLPADFDQRMENETGDLLAILQRQGKLLAFPCESNGSYSLAIYVGEPLPAELTNYCEQAERIPDLQVADDGWYGGLEYCFRDDRSFLDSRPTMCVAVHLPAGSYDATAYSTKIPDEVYEIWLVEKSNPTAKLLWDIQSWFGATGVVATAVFVSCLFFAPRSATLISLSVASALSLIALALSRTAAYRQVQQARADYQAMYPNFVLLLRSVL